MTREAIHTTAMLVSLALVFVGVGMTFGWWLGGSAAAAAWMLTPFREE